MVMLAMVKLLPLLIVGVTSVVTVDGDDDDDRGLAFESVGIEESERETRERGSREKKKKKGNWRNSWRTNEHATDCRAGSNKMVSCEHAYSRDIKRTKTEFDARI